MATVTQAAPSVRTTAAALAAAAVPLVVVAALGNQALRAWREARAADADHWTANLVQALAIAAWRVTPASGPKGTEHWLAPVVFDVVLIVLTALLAAAAARGRGRGAVFAGVWGATALAGAVAGLACTPLAYAGVPGTVTADEYRTTLAAGLLLGFLLGVLAGLAALLVGSIGGGGRGGRVPRDDDGADADAPGAQSPRGLEETWPLSE